MNWEVVVYRTTARAVLHVRGKDIETKRQAQEAALRIVQAGNVPWEKSPGVVAEALTWPYDQRVQIENTPRFKMPKNWSPPSEKQKLYLPC